MAPLKTIIVDDHPAVRFGLEAVLHKFEDILVVGVAESGEKGLELCSQHDLDVALIDMYMPGMSGIETVEAIHQRYPDIKLIMLTHAEQVEVITDVLNAGAMGYLVKNAEIDAIVDAIRSAAAGRRILSPEALEAVIRSKSTPQVHPDNQLTERELEVLTLMVMGLKNPQIAEQLVITVSTVKFHISTIFRKLDVSTRTEAVVTAINQGLVDHHNSNVAAK